MQEAAITVTHRALSEAQLKLLLQESLAALGEHEPVYEGRASVFERLKSQIVYDVETHGSRQVALRTAAVRIQMMLQISDGADGKAATAQAWQNLKHALRDHHPKLELMVLDGAKLTGTTSLSSELLRRDNWAPLASLVLGIGWAASDVSSWPQQIPAAAGALVAVALSTASITRGKITWQT